MTVAIPLTQMRANTVAMVAAWGETLTPSRPAATFDGNGRETVTFTAQSTFSGIWQAVTGQTVRAEAGRQTKSAWQVIAAYNVSLLEGDKVARSTGEYGIVNYITKYPEHVTIYLAKTEGEPA
jgi:hypothetical protein